MTLPDETLTPASTGRMLGEQEALDLLNCPAYQSRGRILPDGKLAHQSGIEKEIEQQFIK